jgi:hypothetical protein
MQIDLTYLGDRLAPDPQWQAQPQALNSSFGRTKAETRAAFVQAWNEQTGESKTEADFTWVNHAGPSGEDD